MAFELIGALLAAAALGLIAWAARRWFAGMPKWSVPVAAGVGLIGATIWLEYDWFNRVSAELPPGFVVVNAEAAGSPLRPWTYVVPLVTRFDALDMPKRAQHPNRAEMVMLPVYGFARWKVPQNMLMIFDCAGKRRVPLTETVTIHNAGTLTGGEWVVLDANDEMQEAACREG